MQVQTRRFPVGAELLPGGGVDFRVWAPRRSDVRVVFPNEAGREVPLRSEGNGYFAEHVPRVRAGSRYGFRLDGTEKIYPDPASRFQPDGPHGLSEIIDPAAFAWNDGDWRGRSIQGQVIYEMHIGTFTREGTWAAAERELPELARIGITVIEVMPVADFAGRWGWGYDGVNMFAPTRLYGRPDDFRRFVDAAHAAGLAVILDVVYNHLGPDGNYLNEFSRDYFTDRYETDWGDPINFDGENSGPVREFFITNAAYWIEEFHIDGLRLDATQNVYDASDSHILKEVTARVREAAGRRATIVVAENEPQHVALVQPREAGGYGIDALWNDDLHHSALVALTGRAEAYYTDYAGTAQEFISAAKYGYLFQGQWYGWQKQRRGTQAFGVPPYAFVNFIENHDQVANSGRGLRVHAITSPGRYRAMTALMLLLPGTPMLFQGQEFASSRTFCYFADHNPELAPLVSEGRKEFLRQFPSLATVEMQKCLIDASSPEAFESSKLNLSEREKHAAAYRMHCELLRLRRDDATLRQQRPGGVDGAVLGEHAFVLRYFGRELPFEPASEGVRGDQDRLLVVNFGRELHCVPASEPLLAPPEGHHWDIQWSSEDPRYGGVGTPRLDYRGWHLPAESAVLLQPRHGLLPQENIPHLKKKETAQPKAQDAGN